VPDRLELEEGRDLPRALTLLRPAHDALHILGRRALELLRRLVEVERVDVQVRGEVRRELAGAVRERAA